MSTTGDPSGIPHDTGGEGQKLVESIKAIQTNYFSVWHQGPPRHYTYLKLFQEEGVFRVDYKDSAIPNVAPGNLVWAKQILVNLGLENLVEGITPSNKLGQKD